MNKITTTFAFLMLFSLSFVHAQQADFSKWQIRLRATTVIPTPSAEIGIIGGDIDINSKLIPELDITYFFTKNIAAELILGTTKHNVKTSGSNLSAIGGASAASVDLGSVWLLPPTLTAQYHFLPENTFRPYVGAGVNYTIFYGVNEGRVVQGVDYKNKFGFATQLGADYQLNDLFFLNFDIKYILLKTDVDVNASNLASGLQIPAKVTINPLLFSLGFGIKF